MWSVPTVTKPFPPLWVNKVNQQGINAKPGLILPKMVYQTPAKVDLFNKLQAEPPGGGVWIVPRDSPDFRSSSLIITKDTYSHHPWRSRIPLHFSQSTSGGPLTLRAQLRRPGSTPGNLRVRGRKMAYGMLWMANWLRCAPHAADNCEVRGDSLSPPSMYMD